MIYKLGIELTLRMAYFFLYVLESFSGNI